MDWTTWRNRCTAAGLVPVAPDPREPRNHRWGTPGGSWVLHRYQKQNGDAGNGFSQAKWGSKGPVPGVGVPRLNANGNVNLYCTDLWNQDEFSDFVRMLRGLPPAAR